MDRSAQFNRELNQLARQGEKLDLPRLRTRIERFFQLEMLHLGKDAEFLMRVVRALVDEGEFSRAQMRGDRAKGNLLPSDHSTWT
jgi:hypothetical protein